MTVSIILKRNISIFRIILGALLGALSIFILFININSIELFIIKVLISILMCLVAFKYKDIKYTLTNISYLYMISIILGGFLYLLNIEFSYKNNGLIFFHKNLSVNYYLLLLISPVIIYLYIRQSLKLKMNYSNYYKVDIYLKNKKVLKLNGYLDTGNKLYDQYKNRPIILVYSKFLNYDYQDLILVPYETLNNRGIIKCFKPNKIVINDVVYQDVLVGISKEKFKIDGIDCILHRDLIGG